MSDKEISNLEQALVDAISLATSGAEKATEFLVAEVPEIVQQALLYYGVKHGLLFTIGVILSLYALTVFRSDWVEGEDYTHDDLTGQGLLKVMRFSLIVPGAIFMFANLEWLKNWLAPKLWLIEFAAQFIK